jgi:hypothetical protein
MRKKKKEKERKRKKERERKKENIYGPVNLRQKASRSSASKEREEVK